MSLNYLKQIIKNNNLPVSITEIDKAYEFAAAAHKDQVRLSGNPYITHPVSVATILAEMKADQSTILAGLLHDTVEDTDTDLKEIEEKFGKEVRTLVDGVTKLRRVHYRGTENYIENFRRMFLAMAKDLRVILVKFADQVHNLQSLEFLPKEKRQRFVRETLEIYAPIANRLRLGRIKGELEDWAFKYADPEEFRWLNNLTMKLYASREQTLEKIKEEIKKSLEQENIKVYSIHDRTKHLYSLYNKMKKNNLDINQVYDLVALRIIVPEISDCYAVLGIIHRKYRPLKGRIKDYIAQPKPNGYQSLHTTVFAEDGQIVEFQIRTPKMHEEAEFGLAAHWHYKEKGSFQIEKKLAWVKELAKLAREMHNENELETLKIDIFLNRIFVFTPKGDVIELPEESTPVDFAYSIHTDVGNKCSKAKINDKISSLDTKLRNGDVIEIIMDKNRKGPNVDWLKFVKTNAARGRIKQYTKKKMTEWEKNINRR